MDLVPVAILAVNDRINICSRIIIDLSDDLRIGIGRCTDPYAALYLRDCNICIRGRLFLLFRLLIDLLGKLSVLSLLCICFFISGL